MLILIHTVKIYRLSSHESYSTKDKQRLIIVFKSLFVLRPNFMLRYYLNSHPGLQFWCSTTESNVKFTDRHSNCSRRLLAAPLPCGCFSRAGIFIGHI